MVSSLYSKSLGGGDENNRSTYHRNQCELTAHRQIVFQALSSIYSTRIHVYMPIVIVNSETVTTPYTSWHIITAVFRHLLQQNHASMHGIIFESLLSKQFHYNIHVIHIIHVRVQFNGKTKQLYMHIQIQWSPSRTDTIGTETSVHYKGDVI